VAKRTARQWITNIILLLVTLSFLGVSMAPLIGQILSPTANPKAATPSTAEKSETEKLKIQIQGYEDILKTEPNNQFALQQITDLKLRLVELGDEKVLPSLVQPLDRLAEMNPKETGYRLQLGRVKAYLKDKEGAIAEYRKILTIAPGNLDALKSLVSIELSNKRPEAAIGVLDEAIASADTANKVQPNSVDKTAITLLKGDVYLSQKRFEDATFTYEKVAKANAKDFRPILGKALVARAEGKETEAAPLFETAAKLAPPEYRDEVNKLAVKPSAPVTIPKPVDPNGAISPLTPPATPVQPNPVTPPSQAAPK
jgi:tetratricopeptide (TPR) repeat protein